LEYSWSKFTYLDSYAYTGFHNQGFNFSVNPNTIVITDQMLNDSLCCSYKYNRFEGKFA